MRPVARACAIVLLFAPWAIGQTPEPSPSAPTASAPERFAYISITDKKGRPVQIDPGSLEVDYGSSHGVADVQSAAQVPLDFAVVIDLSRSMVDKWAFEKKTVLQIFHAAGANGGRGFLVAFREQPHISGQMTDADVAAVLKITAPTGGGSALYDAIIAACEKAFQGEPARGRRRALFIVSDGGDNTSHHTKADAIQAALRSRVSLFSFGLFDEVGEFGKDRATMKDLARMTGGLAILLEQPTDLSRPISELLSTQYQLKLPPNPSGDPQRLEVKPADKKIRVALPQVF